MWFTLISISRTLRLLGGDGRRVNVGYRFGYSRASISFAGVGGRRFRNLAISRFNCLLLWLRVR